MKNGLFISVLALLFCANWASAQQPAIQYHRSWDKDGINVFEPTKKGEQPEFTGFKIRIGGAFTQDFQSLTHENKAKFTKNATTGKDIRNTNFLYGVGTAYTPAAPKDTTVWILNGTDSTSTTLSGFNLAMANLNFDMQIGDGIRVCLENYMSSRHHSEFWVKGGYIQIDKLPMFGSPEWFTKYLRVKIGHFQPNFGDMQFRRSDGGNTIYNPFVENLIFDAFTTEIGGEVYVFPVDGFMGMLGLTSGFINGNIDNYPTTAIAPSVVANKKSPSITLKLAYDKTFGDFRFRLSASMYNNNNIQRNTLYAGDRTGSHYFMVMEQAIAPGKGSNTAASYASNKDSGRFTSMGVTNKINAISINPFIKFHGLEVFGDYQIIKGRTNAERDGAERKFNQLAVEGLYRFLKNEQAYVGARYIKATGTPQGFTSEISMDRTAIAAGWFPTKNMLLKGEYVIQNYDNFTDYREGGKFSGFVVEAVIGF
jgi:hypothetical protein